MRHGKHKPKLGRKSEHKHAMLANMACSLIEHKRITTTLAKAKALKPIAEKLITMGKKGDIHNRRLASAELGQDSAVKTLFSELATRFKNRQGGYTRILKLGYRTSDAAPMALIEWVEEEIAPRKKSAKSKPAKETQQEASDASQEAVEQAEPSKKEKVGEAKEE